MASRPDPDSTRVYRIVSRRYPPFDGAGAWRWGSRWISPGQSVVHAAESYALAMLENLAHWQTRAIPKDLVYVVAEIPRGMAQEALGRAALPDTDPADYAAFREIGDEWYRRGETAALWVPSMVSPIEANVLINQTHEDFARLRIHAPRSARIDPRLPGIET